VWYYVAYWTISGCDKGRRFVCPYAQRQNSNRAEIVIGKRSMKIENAQNSIITMHKLKEEII